MKSTIYKIIIIFIFVNITNINADSDVFKKIELINSLKLKKVMMSKSQIDNRQEIWENISEENFKNNKISNSNDRFMIYVDEGNNIRKVIIDKNYTEGKLWLVEYFDVNGDFICLYFSESIAGPDDFYSTSGSLIKNNDGKILFDTVYKKTFPEQAAIYNKPLFKSYFDNTNDLLKYLRISNIVELVKSCAGTYTFITPRKGSKVHITGNDVILREKPGKSAKPIKKLYTGNLIKIISIEHNERIEGLGKYFWYEIIDESNDKGYIFGKYLDFAEEQKNNLLFENLNNK